MTVTDYAAQPATLLDVARVAKVSPSTVSRILNGTAKVSDDKRQAVMAAIAEMNFAPNQMAQGLKRGRSMTIGIVVQDISSPFFDETLHGIDDGLKNTGYASVIVSGHWDAAEESDRIRLLLARKADGIILLSGRLSNEAILQFSQHKPIVSTGRLLATSNALGFKLDNTEGARMAVRHLIELGHRRIAFVTGPDDSDDANDRLAGYIGTLQDAGIPIDENLIVKGNFHEAGGMMALNQLFETRQQFTAVFCANDLSANGARLGLYRRGIRVPDDISLVGFDDLPSSAYVTPPLTTVRQPLYDMGRMATQALMNLLNGEPTSAVLPSLELVVRETTRKIR